MKKMTMQQELEMLRNEVQNLKARQKEDIDNQDSSEEDVSTKFPVHRGDINTFFKEQIEQLEDDVKDQVEDIIKTLKKDYETISPVSALILFAVGAAFGRALSSRSSV